MQYQYTPLRKLVQSHYEGLITKDDYLTIRTMLLDKLEQQGRVSFDDLDNFLNIKKVSTEHKSSSNYGSSDIIIITLGVFASIALAYILYS